RTPASRDPRNAPGPCPLICGRSALRLFLNGWQEAIGLERASDTGNRYARYGERPEQARAEAHRGDHVLLPRIDFAHHAAEPAFGADLVGLAGVPDVHGAEMRARRIRKMAAMQKDPVLVVVQLTGGNDYLNTWDTAANAQAA